MRFVPLIDAGDASRFGAKAALLAQAARASLPVPAGYAIAADALDALVTAAPALQLTAAELAMLEPLAPVAVRASRLVSAANGGGTPPVSLLRVSGAPALASALRAVHASARNGAPLAAIVQRMVEPRCAGVLGTRDPVSGAEEYVIEAAWDLAESPAIMVAPDRYRLSYTGALLETLLGERPAPCFAAAAGGARPRTRTRPQADAPCLQRPQLLQLVELARSCQARFGRRLELEWALARDGLSVLRIRPISAITCA